MLSTPRRPDKPEPSLADWLERWHIDLWLLLMLLAVAIPLTYVGGRLGSRIAQRIDQQLFNRVVGCVLLASGVLLMLK